MQNLHLKIAGGSEDFSFGEFPDDFDHFEPYLEKSFHRLLMLEKAGIRKFFPVLNLLHQILSICLEKHQKYKIFIHVVVSIALELQVQEELEG